MATPPLGVIAIADPSSFYEPTVPVGGTGNVQWYSFTLTETHWVDIDTSNSFGPPDTELVLYDGVGTIIAQNDDDPTSGAVTSRITMELDADTYYICVGMYKLTALPDCEASSGTTNAGGIALYVTFYPDPPGAESTTLPRVEDITLSTNPKWYRFNLSEGQTLKGTAPGCVFLLYSQDGQNIWDDDSTLEYNVVLGAEEATAPFWLAVTQAGDVGPDWGDDFFVDPDGVYTGPPITVTIWEESTPPPDPGTELQVAWYTNDIDGRTPNVPPSTVGYEGVTGHFTGQTIFGGIVGYAGGTVVWSPSWTPAVDAPSPDLIWPEGFPGQGDSIAIQMPSLPIRYGTLLLSATVGGEPVNGVLRIVFVDDGGEFSYGSVAWDVMGLDPGDTDFWTGFRNTFEVP